MASPNPYESPSQRSTNARHDVARLSPSTVRWRILALLMAYAGMVHFNRISISVAGNEHIMKDYGVSETQMGMVYSSYLLVYTLCMIPGGWLIDRLGPKRALMLLGFGSAVLVPATGLAKWVTPAAMVVVLCCIRAMLGICSAPMHPGAARAVSLWLPFQQRGVANGLVTGAAVAGVAGTYYLFGFLMDLAGWPTAFLLAGGATLVLTLIWSAYATDRPGDHRDVNPAELEQIQDGDLTLKLAREKQSDSLSLDDQLAQFSAILGNSSLVMLTASYAALSYFQYLFFYWMQYYFETVLKLGPDAGRLYATIPTIAMAIGMVCGGWISDQVGARIGGPRGRKVTPICGMIASAICLLIGISGQHPAWFVVTCFALAMGTLGASEPAFWMTGIELGRERGAVSAAILNTGGNAGGILAPVITPLFSSYFGWQAGLALASLICGFGALLWLGVRVDDGRLAKSPG